MNNQFLRIFGLLAFFGLTMFQSLQAQCTGFSSSVSVAGNPSCQFNSGGMFTNTSGGASPYTYLWSNGATTSGITNLGAGTYSVVVRDANNCTVTSNATLVRTMNVSFYSVSNPSCTNSNGTIGAQATSGTAPYTYLWNTGATAGFLTNRSAGTYTVTITDATGCRGIASRTLTQSTTFNAYANANVDASCGRSNGEIQSSTSGGTAPFTYYWSNGQTRTTNIITGLSAGTYRVTVSDANGCTAASNNATVYAQSNLNYSITSNDPTNCASTNGSIIINTPVNGIAPYTYSWANGYGNTNTVTGLAAGGYFGTITDAGGCVGYISHGLRARIGGGLINVSNNCSNTQTYSVQVPSGTNVSNYQWSTGTNNATATTQSYTVGQFVEVIVNASNYTCSDTFRTIAATNAPSVQIFDSTYNACATSRLLYTTMPYQNYLWSNGATTAYASYNAGQWAVVTVTNANGCQGVDSFYVQNTGSGLQVNATATNIGCTSASLGSATAQVSGGQAPYAYVWSNGYSASNTATGLAVGAYTVQVTDANGCRGYDSVFVQQNNSSIFVQILDSTHNACVTSRLLYTTMPYQNYLWSNGATTAYASYNAGQWAVVTVTNANGCRGVDSFHVQASNSSLQVYTSVSSPGCTSASLGSATAQASGGQAPYTYMWSNGYSASNTATGLSTGVYIVQVTDANGCRGVDSFYVQAGGNNFTVSLYDSSTNCNDSIRMIAVANLQGVFGQGFSVFAWSNGSQNAFGDYQIGDWAEVTITNPSTGCQAIGQFYVSPAVGNISFWGMTNNTNCTSTASTGSIFVSGSGQYQYLWSTGATTSSTSGMSSYSSIQNLAQGWYGLTVTDGNSCENTADFYVDVDSNCLQLISGYAYLLQQQAPSNCQPNNTPCMYCEIAIDNGTTVDYVFTDNNGYYEYSTSNVGVHTISFANTNMLSAHTISCPSNNSISVTLAATGSYTNNNFFVYVAPVIDLSLFQYNITNIVPGFQYTQISDICNYGDQPANGTYTFNYPAGLQYNTAIDLWNSSNAAFVTVSNNPNTRTITINFTGLAAYECMDYFISFDVDTTLTIGDTLCFTANVAMTNGTEPDLTNNSYAACLPVDASYDPNDKRVTNHSGGDQKRGTISPAQTDLHYVIRFQNTGTAPARRVIIRDDLAATLLPNTISNIASSHPCQLQIIDGQLVATFLNLNLLPQSASEALSQGFVSFNIQRQAGLPVGTRIDNTASIFFDYNSPIITNTAQTTIAQMVAVAETRAAEMSLQVMPNPFNGQLSVAYELATDSKVRISLINVLGETVMQVANNTQTAGNQQFSINTQDLGAGIYYLMVETEAGRFAQKVIKQ